MRNRVELRDGERIDELQRNGYGIIQNTSGFCFGMDAVLLSGFASVRANETAVDLGTGTGIIPILLRAKTAGRHFYGVEIQPAVAEMARRSVMLNDLSEEIDIIDGDIREIAAYSYGKHARTAEQRSGYRDSVRAELCGAGEGEGAEKGLHGVAALPFGICDVVTSNPPYMKNSSGLKNPDAAKAISRHEVLCDLGDVCRAAAKLLREGGRFYMVHRPLRLIEITAAMQAVRLEPKRMKFVHPFLDQEANMVLIEAVKGAKSECRIEKPMIVYESRGVYTQEIYDLYGY